MEIDKKEELMTQKIGKTGKKFNKKKEVNKKKICEKNYFIDHEISFTLIVYPNVLIENIL